MGCLLRLHYFCSTFSGEMARKIREYDSKRLLNEHFKRLSGRELPIKSAQITESTDLNELANNEPWLSSSKVVVKPNMLFGKRGKNSLVALNLDYAQVATFVTERLGKELFLCFSSIFIHAILKNFKPKVVNFLEKLTLSLAFNCL
ncbi:ATP-citrate synthase alpha chain protein 2-like [Morus notabilis]|uniref:ATP-citrate synthase alpha chain protein 2-like n=1 Tax=Morus notabilis TaxID=981085 RepID=UPI000CED6EFF|nr:ATP-citrate synthase alpha chain protein 2-like [Morus notabilis]